MQSEIQKIKTQISKGKIELAIQAFQFELEKYGHREEVNDIMMISARYAKWKQKTIQGLEVDNVELNRVQHALITLLEDFELRRLKTNYTLEKVDNDQSEFIGTPTLDNPMLIGLLVDVSGSMLKSIDNKQGLTISRIKSFQSSFSDLVDEAKRLCTDEGNSNGRILPLFRLFALGFGFGNPFFRLINQGTPNVKSLLDNVSSSDTITIESLATQWATHQRYSEKLVQEMFGTTPLMGALKTAKKVIEKEGMENNCMTPSILFILSDGKPTDAAPDEILMYIEQLKSQNTLIISCYITDEDLTRYKVLYESPASNWPVGAKLLLNCSSMIPKNNMFYSHLTELGWSYTAQSKLFTQVNESDNLKEFLKLVLTPLRNSK